MYLYMFYDLDLLRYSNDTFLNKYIELLKTSIMTIPSERKTPNIMKKMILKLFKKVYRKNIKNLNTVLKEQYDNKEVIKKLEKNMTLHVYSVCYNEELMLPYFLRHYSHLNKF